MYNMDIHDPSLHVICLFSSTIEQYITCAIFLHFGALHFFLVSNYD